MDVSKYTPICNAFILLLQPLVEVVIHDLNIGKICYINGNISKRTVGDPSLLDVRDTEIDSVVYSKINFDGRLLQSISIPIENNQALLCINYDVSVFSQLHELSKLLIKKNISKQPKSLFENDWQEKLHIAIHHKIKEEQWNFETLNNAQKKEIVHYLFITGAFKEKNAADYIAKILQLGRATVFNYLRKWKNNEN